jgi:signal peptidase II
VCRLQTTGGTAIDTPRRHLGLVRLTLILIAAGAYALDQFTKQWAVTTLEPGRPVPLIGDLLHLHLLFNPGAAFSLGEEFTVVFAVFGILALGFVAFWLAPRVRNYPWAVAIGLILCGIGGNLTDRIARPPAPFHGYVVDFLQLPHWPVFNVADMCLVFGVGIMIWLMVVRPLPLTASPFDEDDASSGTADEAPSPEEATRSDAADSSGTPASGDRPSPVGPPPGESGETA